MDRELVNMAASKDPTPAEIAAACLDIQATWSERERMSRLRVDLRPTFTTADGRTQDITSETYNEHHRRREMLTG
jgi:hypothetical protein